MTEKEQDRVDAAEGKAWNAAKQAAGTDRTTALGPIVDDARLRVLEVRIATLCGARTAGKVATSEHVVAQLESYWADVATEIAKP